MVIGRTSDTSYGDTLCVNRCGAFDALLCSIHRASSGLLATARGLCDAAVHGHFRKLKAYVAVVSFEHHFAQFLDPAGYDPVVASESEGGNSAQLMIDTFVGTAEHQNLNEL